MLSKRREKRAILQSGRRSPVRANPNFHYALSENLIIIRAFAMLIARLAK